LLNCGDKKNTTMGLLVTLNEEGYQTLKKDREVIITKIKELEMVLKELDPAYKILQPFYEPKINISLSELRGENVYVGSVFVVPGDKVMKRRIKFVINSVNQYKDINDERLLEDAKKIARDELIKFFPTYFE
jgi:ATP phosphoribosyltransferase regulatory subunit HisZ